MEEEEVVIQIDQTFKKTKNESLKGIFYIHLCVKILQIIQIFDVNRGHSKSTLAQISQFPTPTPLILPVFFMLVRFSNTY